MAHENKSDKRDRVVDEMAEERGEGRAGAMSFPGAAIRSPSAHQDESNAFHATHQAEPKAVQAHPASSTVRMKYTGVMKGTQKIVQLPIPLVAQSQKLEKVLTFTRPSETHGPLFCDVPMEWAGALLEVGGYFASAEKLTPEASGHIAAAKNVTAARMKTFAEENTGEDL